MLVPCFIIFFIISCFIFLYLRIKFITFEYLNFENITNVEDILNNSKNGDLLFLSGSTHGEKAIRWYHSSQWSHCSFIFRDVDENTGKDIAYIFESDLGQGSKDGPRVMRLKDKLDRWKGENIIAWKKYNGDIKTYDILKIATFYHINNYDFDNKMYSWFFSSNPNSFFYKYVKDEKKVFCSELVADVLQKLGIISKDHTPSWYTPKDIFEYPFKYPKNYSKEYYIELKK